MNFDLSIASLKKISQDSIISKLATGDVVKVKSEFLPIISHYGIISRETDDFMVYHNDPDKFNFLGGNIVSEKFEDWIKGKEIITVYNTGISKEEILKWVNENKYKKYDVLKFNCEHFITNIKNKNGISPQVFLWSGIAISILIAAYLMRKK